MNGRRDYHTKQSQSERKTPYDITYMWNLKCDTNHISTKQKQTYRNRKKTCGCRRKRCRGEKDWEFGISRGKLLAIGWINNKVLLYSTGSYIQYPVINHNGKENEKENKYR